MLRAVVALAALGFAAADTIAPLRDTCDYYSNLVFGADKLIDWDASLANGAQPQKMPDAFCAASAAACTYFCAHSLGALGAGTGTYLTSTTLGCGTGPESEVDGAEVPAFYGACCQCTIASDEDPWMTGLRGQNFLFEGEEGHWYSLIHEPDRLNVNMKIYAPTSDASTTFINGAGITFYEEGKEHRILINVKDTEDFHPQCPEGEVCIANGALELEIDGVKIKNPGHSFVGDQVEFSVFNTPWECKRVTKAHENWDKVELAMAQKDLAKNSRRLVMFEPQSDLLGNLYGQKVFDRKFCDQWLNERASQKDLFSVKAQHATMYLSLATFAIQVEFTLNTDPRWIDHQRLDVTLINYAPSDTAKTGGVLGETAELKYDDVLKTPILQGRDEVLSGPDSDYEVQGPFDTEFKARNRSQLRKLL